MREQEKQHIRRKEAFLFSYINSFLQNIKLAFHYVLLLEHRKIPFIEIGSC